VSAGGAVSFHERQASSVGDNLFDKSPGVAAIVRYRVDCLAQRVRRGSEARRVARATAFQKISLRANDCPQLRFEVCAQIHDR
jgi:hypothetical protein